MKAILRGVLVKRQEANINLFNRGLQYGDALFETMRGYGNLIYFWEEHYFRLVASMRILRMPIPMQFTPDYLLEEMQRLIDGNNFINKSFVIKLLVWREAEGRYAPKNAEIGYSITMEPIDTVYYKYSDSNYEVSLFRDYYVQESMLSNLKTTNRIINILGSIYADENEFDNCLLLNNNKHVVEALNANLFLVSGYKIRTPRLESGCINGMMRKQIIKLIGEWPDYILEEDNISPFELQKADEMFITNSRIGIQAISKYRKKIYSNEVSSYLHRELNSKIKMLIEHN